MGAEPESPMSIKRQFFVCAIWTGILFCLLVGFRVVEMIKTQNAVIAAMDTQAALAKQLIEDAKTDELLAFQTFATKLEQVEIKSCPEDFQAAWLRCVFATRRFEAQIRGHPQGFWSGFFTGLLNFCYGEFDGGARRMIQERNEYNRQYLDQMNELLIVAAMYVPSYDPRIANRPKGGSQ